MEKETHIEAVGKAYGCKYEGKTWEFFVTGASGMKCVKCGGEALRGVFRSPSLNGTMDLCLACAKNLLEEEVIKAAEARMSKRREERREKDVN
jgi:hypothetical protein